MYFSGSMRVKIHNRAVSGRHLQYLVCYNMLPANLLSVLATGR